MYELIFALSALIVGFFFIFGVVVWILSKQDPKFMEFNPKNFPAGTVVVAALQVQKNPNQTYTLLIKGWTSDGNYYQLDKADGSSQWFPRETIYNVSAVEKENENHDLSDTAWLNDADWWKKGKRERNS